MSTWSLGVRGPGDVVTKVPSKGSYEGFYKEGFSGYFEALGLSK